MFDRLPYEILRQIIKLKYKHRPIVPSLESADNVNSLPILETHVCHSWRWRLISDPTMWTYIRIPKKDKGRTEELIRRSARAPLNVTILACGWVLDAHAIDIVLRETHRFQNLKITIIAPSEESKLMVRKVLQIFERPAPKLSTLSVTIHAAGNRWATDNSEEFPRILFSETPNLKVIRLQASPGFDEIFFSPLFRNLFEIHLESQDVTIVHSDHLLDILEQSPQLRSLAISPKVDEETATLPRYPERRVHLPNLRRLLLGLNLENYITFEMADFILQHIEFPIQNIDMLRINCNDLHVHKSEPRAERLLHIISQRCYTHLKISPFDAYEYEYSSDIVITLNDSRSYPEKSTFSTRYDIDHEPEENFSDFLRMFPLTNITSLVLEEPAFSSASFCNIFTSLRNLKRLDVIYESPDAEYYSEPELLVMALMPSFGDSSHNGLNDIPCPSLHDIQIDFLNCKVELSEEFFQKVVICAEARRRIRLPFRSISIFCPPPVILDKDAVEYIQNLGSKRLPIVVTTD